MRSIIFSRTVSMGAAILMAFCLGCHSETRIGGTKFLLRPIGRSHELHPERIALGVHKNGKFMELWPAISIQCGVVDVEGEILFGSKTPEGGIALFGVGSDGVIAELSRSFSDGLALASITKHDREYVVTFWNRFPQGKIEITVSAAQIHSAIHSVIGTGKLSEWGGFQYFRDRGNESTSQP